MSGGPPSYDSLFNNDGSSKGAAAAAAAAQSRGRSASHDITSSSETFVNATRPPAFNPVYDADSARPSNTNYVPFSSSPNIPTSSSFSNNHHATPHDIHANITNGLATNSSVPKTSTSSWLWPFGGSRSNGSSNNSPAAPPQPHHSPSAPSPAAVAAPPPQIHHYSDQEETELRGLFSAVDEDGDGHITIAELQSALLNDNWTPFKLATIQMLVRMFDEDVNQTIEFDEFRDMKSYVQQFQAIFDTYDADRSGTIDQHEVKQALSSLGFNVGEQFCYSVCCHFRPPTTNRSRFSPAATAAGSAVNLDSFIQICASVKHSSRLFEQQHHASRITTTACQAEYETFLWSELTRMH